MTFLDCPAYLDQRGALRCGLPAEVEYRHTVESSGGPMESAKIRCPSGHWFNGPIESLLLPRTQEAADTCPGSAHLSGEARGAQRAQWR